MNFLILLSFVSPSFAIQTQLPKFGCANWCERHTHSWAVKCGPGPKRPLWNNGACADCPQCSEVPSPAPPSPAPPIPAGAYVGEWVTCYPSTCPGPEAYPDASFKMCFAGEADFAKNKAACANAPDLKWLSIGGGPGFTVPTPDEMSSLAGLYEGVALDIKSYPDQDVNAISDALTAAKRAGLRTMVTVAHSGYGMTAGFMIELLSLTVLDYASPQLYTTSPCIQKTESDSFSWADWATVLANDETTAQVLPSVPQGDFQTFASYDSITFDWCSDTFYRACPGVVVWPTTGECDPSDRDWP